VPGENVHTQFEQLLQLVIEPAYGTAVRFCRSRDDAEDLVGEATLQAYRAFHTFAQGTNFRAWFLKILTNLFFQSYRKQQREPEIVELADAPDLYLYGQMSDAGLLARSQDPAELVLGRLDQEEVGAAIESLPLEFRVVSTLYFMEDLSYAEIADILDCPVGTVRSRLHRGRKLLQKSLWQIAVEAGVIGALMEEAV